jgi:hypothetical protein
MTPPIGLDPARDGTAPNGGTRCLQLDGAAVIAARPATASRHQRRPRPRLTGRTLRINRGWRSDDGPARCILPVYDTGREQEEDFR